MLTAGAAPGNVAESVILERESESTIMFVEGAKQAYAGHLTLKFTPDVTSTVPHHKHFCLEVGENCSPTVDHCIIRSTSVGKFTSSLVVLKHITALNRETLRQEAVSLSQNKS